MKIIIILLAGLLASYAVIVAGLEEWREPAPETQRAQEDEHE